jgi:hypothetical protein
MRPVYETTHTHRLKHCHTSVSAAVFPVSFI